jgi:hypothetical protein
MHDPVVGRTFDTTVHRTSVDISGGFEGDYKESEEPLRLSSDPAMSNVAAAYVDEFAATVAWPQGPILVEEDLDWRDIAEEVIDAFGDEQDEDEPIDEHLMGHSDGDEDAGGDADMYYHDDRGSRDRGGSAEISLDDTSASLPESNRHTRVEQQGQDRGTTYGVTGVEIPRQETKSLPSSFPQPPIIAATADRYALRGDMLRARKDIEQRRAMEQVSKGPWIPLVKCVVFNGRD